MTNAAELLAVFADPTRQAVLHLLRERPRTVGELAERLPVSRPAVSQHLQLLKTVRLVREQRQGTRHFFSLDPQRLGEVRAHIDSMWRDALAAFSQFAKKETRAHAQRKSRTRSSKRGRRLPD